MKDFISNFSVLIVNSLLSIVPGDVLPRKAACKGTKTFRDLSGVRFYMVLRAGFVLLVSR